MLYLPAVGHAYMHNPYAELKAADWSAPSNDILHVQRDDTTLFTLVGNSHPSDPDNGEIDTLIQGWDQFVVNADPEARIIYCEGRPLHWRFGAAEGVRAIGDRAILGALADMHNVPYHSWDPEPTDVFPVVMQRGHELTALLYYATLRHATQWFRSAAERDISLTQHLDTKLAGYTRQFAPWITPALQDMSLPQLHESLFDIPYGIALRDEWFAYEQTLSLEYTDTPVQRVAVEWNTTRSTSLLRLLSVTALDAFVVMGRDHKLFVQSQVESIGSPMPTLPRSVSPRGFEAFRESLCRFWRTGEAVQLWALNC
jgi:hypothetical protein